MEMYKMESRGKENFTEVFLNNLKCETKRYEIGDTKVTALFIRVNRKSKTFFARKRIEKNIRYFVLGDYPQMTLKDARKKAIDFISDIEENEEELRKKNKENNLPSVKTFFYEVYLPRHAQRMMSEKSKNYVEMSYRKYVDKYIGFKRLDNVTREDIERIQSEALDISKQTSNHVLVMLKTVFNKAVEWRYLMFNPCLGVKKFPTQARSRFLRPDELSRFFKELTSEPRTNIKNFVLMSIYTGQRKSNILSMSWKDIDLTNKLWHIPKTKNGLALDVPLIDEAVELLQRIKPKADSEWVFPAESKSGHYESPKAAWETLLKKLDLTNLRIHDLRRTMGSYEAMADINLPLISRTLGHQSFQSTQIYARMNVESVRSAMTKAVDLMNSRANKAAETA